MFNNLNVDLCIYIVFISIQSNLKAAHSGKKKKKEKKRNLTEVKPAKTIPVLLIG